MTLSKKRITEKEAIWYVCMFERKRLRSKKAIIEIKKGNKVFDIVTKGNTGIRFIEVKGMYYERPSDFRLYKSIRRYNKELHGIPVRSKKYFVYLVYNIYLNKKPRLVILDAEFIRKYGVYRSKDNCIHVHKVAEKIKEEGVTKYTLPWTLTRNKRKFINNSKIRSAKINTHTLDDITIPKGNVSGSRYDKLINFIGSLGDDIIEMHQQIRIAFSSKSRKNNKSARLVWICKLEHSGTPESFWIWLRKDTTQCQYPAAIKTISDYRDDGGYGYPAFKISSNQDLEMAKQMIKFAYNKL